jgi:F-type H+-transporting ATPase subunit epsilon
MADTLELEIVTPDREVAHEQVSEVQIPGQAGYLGVLPGHAPLITELAIGELSYQGDHGTQYLAVAWGFAEVLPDKVTILAETAERAEEINVQRAQEAKSRAEEAIQKAAADLDYEVTLNALRRAEVRLQVAAHAGHTAGARR